MLSKTHVVATIGLSLMLAACNRSATGQIVAVVNGEEISLNELNAELKSLGQVAGNKDTLRAQALQNLVDRKLLVQAAHDRGIDKDPDFLQQQRRGSEQLLVGLLAQQVTKNVPVPSQTDIDAFLRQNPQVGTGRVVMQLDQVQFQEPTDPNFIKQLTQTKSLGDVVAVLNRTQTKFAGQKSTLDSATAPKTMIDQVVKLQPGEPFIVRSGGMVIVSAITSQNAAPLPEPEARKVAAEAIRRAAIAEIAQKQVKDARSRAKIEYQEGFKPKA